MVARLLVFTLCILLASTTFAQAGFIIPIIVAAIGFTGVAASVATFVGTIALAVGVSWVATLLAPKPNQTATQAVGAELDVRIDADLPQSVLFGRVMTAGSLSYAETYGPGPLFSTNSDMVEIITLADHPVEGFVGAFLDETEATFTPAGAGTPGIAWGGSAANRGSTVDGYDLALAIQFYDGTQTAADALAVLALSSQPERPWTSTAIGLGTTYVRIHSVYLPSKVPGPMRWRWVIDGIKLYDPRLDTTVGGSGSHRWDDLDTHEFSTNLAVIAYNILRGIRVLDEDDEPVHLYGLENTPAANLPLDNWFAAMNECDVVIDGEPQYHGGLEVKTDVEPLEALRHILAAMDGRLTEVGGVYKLFVGAPGLPVLSITDETLLADDGDEFRPIIPLVNRVNHATGTYMSPEDGWIPKVAPARTIADWVEEDGRRIPGDLNAPVVQSGSHMQRLMQQMLLKSRQQRRHTIPLPPVCLGIEPGDVIEWNSTQNGYVDKLFVVEAVDEEDTLRMKASIVEVDPTDYDWDAGTDLITETTVSLLTNRPDPKVIEGFNATPHTHEAPNGSVRPAIKVGWDLPTDGDLVRVEVQVRLESDPTNVATFSTDEPAAGEMIILASLTPSTNYEVRGRFISFNGNETEWSLWQDVTTPDALIGTPDLTDELNDRIDAIVAELGSLPDDIGELRRDLDSIAGSVGSINVALFDRLGHILTAVGARYNENQAGITQALVATADVDSALAAFITSLFATNGFGSAEGMLRFAVAATASGAVASFAIEVNIASPESPTWETSGIYLDAMSGFSRIRIVADQTVFQDTEGGTIASLTSNGLSAITINTGELFVGANIVIDGPNGQIVVSD